MSNLSGFVKRLRDIMRNDAGIIGVYGIGVNLDRAAQTLPATRIEIEER